MWTRRFFFQSLVVFGRRGKQLAASVQIQWRCRRNGNCVELWKYGKPGGFFDATVKQRQIIKVDNTGIYCFNDLIKIFQLAKTATPNTISAVTYSAFQNDDQSISTNSIGQPIKEAGTEDLRYVEPCFWSLPNCAECDYNVIMRSPEWNFVLSKFDF